MSLYGLLKSANSRSLEAKVTLIVLSDFADKTLKGKLIDKKVARLLVVTNLIESGGSS